MATKKRTQSEDLASASAAPTGEAAPAGREVLSLDDVLGQDAAIGTLRTALGEGGKGGDRLHHAWIFQGPLGVGKFSTALAFASYLLDPTLASDLSGRLGIDPDGLIHRLIRAGTHPDLHIVTKELAKVSRETKIQNQKQISIPKEVIEEFLTEPASRTRVQIGASKVGKVFIVDEADLLNAASQNVMLKTLEEPPVGTIIILVTAVEDRLLPTIRSRCQRVGFGPLSEASMKAWLKRARLTLDPAHEQWLLKFAAGSPGLAKIAMDHNLITWHETLGPMIHAAEQGRFAVPFGATMHRLVDEQAGAWVKSRPDASKDAANKAWARRMLGYLGEHYRDRLRQAASGGSVGSGEASGPGVGRCVAAIDALAGAEEELNTNVNMQFVFENLAVKLSAERR